MMRGARRDLRRVSHDQHLRALRQPGTGGPSPLARLLAVLVVLGLVAGVSPVVVIALRAVLSLF